MVTKKSSKATAALDSAAKGKEVDYAQFCVAFAWANNKDRERLSREFPGFAARWHNSRGRRRK